MLAEVKEIPAVPVLSSNSPICEGEDLTINIDNVDAGVQYNWIHADGVQTQNGSNWNISNANTDDSGNFR